MTNRLFGEKQCHLAKGEAGNEMNGLNDEGWIEKSEGGIVFIMHEANLWEVLPCPSFMIAIL